MSFYCNPGSAPLFNQDQQRPRKIKQDQPRPININQEKQISGAIKYHDSALINNNA